MVWSKEVKTIFFFFLRRGDELYSVDGDKQSKPQKLMIKCPEGYIYSGRNPVLFSKGKCSKNSQRGRNRIYGEESRGSLKV